MARVSPKPVKQGTRAKRADRFERGLTPLMGGEMPKMERRDDSPLVPKTKAQADYIKAINANNLTFGIGLEGTGKSFLATWIAADQLERREVDKIIITRPIVEAGESMGFLPGDMAEKVAPYFAPIRAILERRLGKGHVEALVKGSRIEFLPLAFMRGCTLDRAFVILDEAQNTSPVQMRMFLTRLGEDSRTVITGSLSQKDIPGPSGLTDAFRRLAGMRGVGCVEFSKHDVVRSGLVADIIARYEHAEDADDRAQLDHFIRATVHNLSRVEIEVGD